MRMLLAWPVLLSLRLLARFALSLHNPTIIGIAGSVGKSSTRNALFAVLKDFAPTRVITGNSETGIPLGILGITAHDFSLKGWVKMLLRAPLGISYLSGTKYLIVEMGIDDPYPPKNMSYLLSIIKPEIAISLNISATHTQQFEKTLQEKNARHLSPNKRLEYLLKRIAEEDTKIITDSGCRIGIFNADDRSIKEQIDEYLVLHRTTTLLSFGKGSRNDISYAGYSVTLNGTGFSFLLKGDRGVEKMSLFLKGYVLPKAYQEVIAAAFLTAYHLGLTPSQMKASFERNFSLPKGRSTLLRGKKQSVLVDSSYNASPSAVSAFLELFRELREQTKRPTVFLLGDMRELGDEAEAAHRELGLEIPKAMDYVYLVGPLTKQYLLPELEKHDSLKEVKWFRTATEAGAYLKENLPTEALLLVKGSQNTIFLEEAVSMLLADRADRRLLCRQDPYWKERKQAFFKAQETAT